MKQWWNRVVRSRLKGRYTLNKYGTKVSVHWCHACGEQFTLCPAYSGSGIDYGGCLSDTCSTYDIDRDAEFLFFAEGREIHREAL